jgi:hypothetical protein
MTKNSKKLIKMTAAWDFWLSITVFIVTAFSRHNTKSQMVKIVTMRYLGMQVEIKHAGKYRNKLLFANKHEANTGLQSNVMESYTQVRSQLWLLVTSYCGG